MHTTFEGCRAVNYDDMTDDEKAYYNNVIKPAIDGQRQYSCPVCRTQDDSAYMWCQDPGCPDGHDQVTSELQRQAAIGVRHMCRSEASYEALSIIADRNRRRMAYFIAMALTTVLGLALIAGMAAWSMPRVERATQEDMQ